jgi:Flp pilus assembly protein TadB
MSPFLAFVLPALAVLCMAVGLLVRYEPPPALFGTEVATAGSDSVSGPAALVARVGRTRPARRLGGSPRHVRQLELAGEPWTVERLGGMKLALCVSLPLVVLVISGVGALTLPTAALAAGIGIGGPEVAVIRAGRRRQANLERQVPDLVELLVATTEAGLSPVVAVRRASEILLDPLGDELRTSVQEIDLGLP